MAELIDPAVSTVLVLHYRNGLSDELHEFAIESTLPQHAAITTSTDVVAALAGATHATPA